MAQVAAEHHLGDVTSLHGCKEHRQRSHSLGDAAVFGQAAEVGAHVFAVPSLFGAAALPSVAISLMCSTRSSTSAGSTSRSGPPVLDLKEDGASLAGLTARSGFRSRPSTADGQCDTLLGRQTDRAQVIGELRAEVEELHLENYCVRRALRERTDQQKRTERDVRMQTVIFTSQSEEQRLACDELARRLVEARHLVSAASAEMPAWLSQAEFGERFDHLRRRLLHLLSGDEEMEQAQQALPVRRQWTSQSLVAPDDQAATQADQPPQADQTPQADQPSFGNSRLSSTRPLIALEARETEQEPTLVLSRGPGESRCAAKTHDDGKACGRVFAEGQKPVFPSVISGEPLPKVLHPEPEEAGEVSWFVRAPISSQAEGSSLPMAKVMEGQPSPKLMLPPSFEVMLQSNLVRESRVAEAYITPQFIDREKGKQLSDNANAATAKFSEVQAIEEIEDDEGEDGDEVEHEEEEQNEEEEEIKADESGDEHDAGHGETGDGSDEKKKDEENTPEKNDAEQDARQGDAQEADKEECQEDTFTIHPDECGRPATSSPTAHAFAPSAVVSKPTANGDDRDHSIQESRHNATQVESRLTEIAPELCQLLQQELPLDTISECSEEAATSRETLTEVCRPGSEVSKDEPDSSRNDYWAQMEAWADSMNLTEVKDSNRPQSNAQEIDVEDEEDEEDDDTEREDSEEGGSENDADEDDIQDEGTEVTLPPQQVIALPPCSELQTQDGFAADPSDIVHDCSSLEAQAALEPETSCATQMETFMFQVEAARVESSNEEATLSAAEDICLVESEKPGVPCDNVPPTNLLALSIAKKQKHKIIEEQMSATAIWREGVLGRSRSSSVLGQRPSSGSTNQAMSRQSHLPSAAESLAGSRPSSSSRNIGGRKTAVVVEQELTPGPLSGPRPQRLYNSEGHSSLPGACRPPERVAEFSLRAQALELARQRLQRQGQASKDEDRPEPPSRAFRPPIVQPPRNLCLAPPRPGLTSALEAAVPMHGEGSPSKYMFRGHDAWEYERVQPALSVIRADGNVGKGLGKVSKKEAKKNQVSAHDVYGRLSHGQSQKPTLSKVHSLPAIPVSAGRPNFVSALLHGPSQRLIDVR